MKRKYKLLIVLFLIPISGYIIYRIIISSNPNPNFYIGQKLDSLNGVYIYYNGGIGHTGKRNLTQDGYNIGLSYQCVEFAKRYYYQYYKHKMPDAYGNAKDFFDKAIKDGKLNARRDLLQFTNPSISKPCIGDLLIFDGHAGNKYGHVAIISNVKENEIEIIQQNPGPFAASRAKYSLVKDDKHHFIKHQRILGWLRK
ncbi:MAG: CHAP domain-containing protein [Bacteroidetes bacterium]|nr:CHAP domain-containing protein [Bacteroidota bacterium]